MLYLLIGHGHDAEETAMKLDPPDDFFRVRLVSLHELIKWTDHLLDVQWAHLFRL